MSSRYSYPPFFQDFILSYFGTQPLSIFLAFLMSAPSKVSNPAKLSLFDAQLLKGVVLPYLLLSLPITS